MPIVAEANDEKVQLNVRVSRKLRDQAKKDGVNFAKFIESQLADQVALAERRRRTQLQRARKSEGDSDA
jgi:post-segregation antitoxin (ccd killing protein)